MTISEPEPSEVCHAELDAYLQNLCKKRLFKYFSKSKYLNLEKVRISVCTERNDYGNYRISSDTIFFNATYLKNLETYETLIFDLCCAIFRLEDGSALNKLDSFRQKYTNQTKCVLRFAFDYIAFSGFVSNIPCAYLGIYVLKKLILTSFFRPWTKEEKAQLLAVELLCQNKLNRIHHDLNTSLFLHVLKKDVLNFLYCSSDFEEVETDHEYKEEERVFFEFKSTLFRYLSFHFLGSDRF